MSDQFSTFFRSLEVSPMAITWARKFTGRCLCHDILKFETLIYNSSLLSPTPSSPLLSNSRAHGALFDSSVEAKNGFTTRFTGSTRISCRARRSGTLPRYPFRAGCPASQSGTILSCLLNDVVPFLPAKRCCSSWGARSGKVNI